MIRRFLFGLDTDRFFDGGDYRWRTMGEIPLFWRLHYRAGMPLFRIYNIPGNIRYRWRRYYLARRPRYGSYR